MHEFLISFFFVFFFRSDWFCTFFVYFALTPKQLNVDNVLRAPNETPDQSDRGRDRVDGMNRRMSVAREVRENSPLEYSSDDSGDSRSYENSLHDAELISRNSSDGDSFSDGDDEVNHQCLLDGSFSDDDDDADDPSFEIRSRAAATTKKTAKKTVPAKIKVQKSTTAATPKLLRTTRASSKR